MTFNDLIMKIAKNNNLSREESRKVVKNIFSEINDIMSVGDNVLIPDFGRFSTVERKSRVGTNLLTNEKVNIPPRTVVKFTPTKLLKDSVSNT